MDTVTQVYAVLENVYGVSPWTMEQIQADWNREDTVYFLEREGHIVGFLAVQVLGDQAEITQIAVHRDYQGQGYGGRLLQRLLEHFQTIFLEVRLSNQPAQHLYKKHGFFIVGTRKNYYHSPVEDALIMKREGNEK